MCSVNRCLLVVLALLLAPGGCYYDMDSVSYKGEGDSGGGGVSVKTLAGTGTQGANDGLATATATFRKPNDVAVDQKSGKVYVADTHNHTIRMIYKGQVSTIAGKALVFGDSEGAGSSARFTRPMGVAVGGDGRIYVADTYNHRIKVISAASPYTVTNFAGSGTKGNMNGGSLAAKFHFPRGVAVDPVGTVYVGDSLSHSIRVIKGGQVETGTGKKSPPLGGFADGALADAKFKYPIGVALNPSAGMIYVADSGNHRIREVNSTAVRTIAGSGNPSWLDAAAQLAQLNSPLDLTFDGKDKIYVADTLNHRIRLLHKNTVSTIGGKGPPGYNDGPGAKSLFNTPTGIDYHASAGVIYVADTENHRIRKITP